jgi:hypothetical protein
MRHRWVAALLAAAMFLPLAGAANADEGMWTFDHFPSAKVAKTYGTAPTAAFLDHVRKSSLRVAGGCSASFISSTGLVMTNHHCVVECVEALSTPTNNYVQNGFLAKTTADEKTCPDFELNQLVRIEDITHTIQSAIAGKTGAAQNTALRAAEANATSGCGKDPAVRCDVVSLYHGGVYDLYHYKRYQDVRLAFAPEFAVAQYGGDPDNFNFPRFDFDIGLLRAYENGKPAVSNDYLRFSPNGSQAGELVYVSGNPGGTSRELTLSQLAFERDTDLPFVLPVLAEFRGILEDYQRLGPEQQRQANETRFYIENDLKALSGQRQALVDPAFFATKVREESALRAAVARDPKLQKAYGSAWDDIARIQTVRGRLAGINNAASAFRQEVLLSYALQLVRAADERTKPNAARLPEYTDQALIALGAELEAAQPTYAELEERQLAFALTKAREIVGTDNAFTRTVLGREAPDALAHRLVSGTKLADAAVRKALFDGGETAILASTDPMIVYARSIDPTLRTIRKTDEDQVDAPTRAAAERIAKARFAVYGSSIDPDATFSPRLSYGSVKGFVDASGTVVPPYTTIGGLFNRTTGAPPYSLPKSWLDAQASLDASTPMNLVTTNDIIGGNSGSPLVNAKGQIVGLIFDGNIFSLGGNYGYDGVKNRSVAVDSRALIVGLSKVYHADNLVTEIETSAAK